jgi:ectoine hydroxylase
MKLTPGQIREYDERGFIILPELLDAEELDILRRQLASTGEGEGVMREKGNGPLRIVFRTHDPKSPTHLPAFEALARDPRLLEPSQQVLRDENLYVWHSKCNMKEAIDGEMWQWHQDMGAWAQDGVQSPDGLTTVLMMLNEATEIGGCLYFVPGSHKAGLIKPSLDEKSTSYSIWKIPAQDMIDLVAKYGEPVPIVGKPGTVVLFHPYILHGSGHNMSTHSRWHVYMVYNQVENKPLPRENQRPEYVVARDYTPLRLGTTDAIRRSALAETA